MTYSEGGYMHDSRNDKIYSQAELEARVAAAECATWKAAAEEVHGWNLDQNYTANESKRVKRLIDSIALVLAGKSVGVEKSDALARAIRAARLEEAKWWNESPIVKGTHEGALGCKCRYCRRIAELSK